METALGAANWVLEKALSKLSDDLVAGYVASSELGSNVEKITTDLNFTLGLLHAAGGRDVTSNPGLHRLLEDMRKRADEAENALDVLHYFRLRDKLDGTNIAEPWVPDDLRGQVDKVSNFSQEDDVGIIGTLPSLVYLRLRIPGVPTEMIVTTGFPVLKKFVFDCDGISRLSFVAGAMPNLQELELRFDPREWDKAAPAGLEHVPSLKVITALKVAAIESLEELRELNIAHNVLIREVFQEAVDVLPSRPAFSSDEYSLGRRSRPHREHAGRARAASPHNATAP